MARVGGVLLSGESASAGARVDAPVLPQAAARERSQGGAGTVTRAGPQGEARVPPSVCPSHH
jgi:hypothetical protein